MKTYPNYPNETIKPEAGQEYHLHGTKEGCVRYESTNTEESDLKQPFNKLYIKHPELLIP